MGGATTTTARDRKELLRTLISEVIVTIQQEPRRAEVQIVWEGGARTELTVALVKRGTERNRTSEDTIELVRKLAVHTADQQIAAILNKQGRRTGTGLPFNQPRVASIRVKHGIPAAPPPDPDSDLFTVEQAANELRVDADHDLPMAQGRPAPGRADHPARALADQAHPRGPGTVRARRSRRLPAARSGREAARVRASDRFA